MRFWVQASWTSIHRNRRISHLNAATRSPEAKRSPVRNSDFSPMIAHLSASINLEITHADENRRRALHNDRCAQPYQFLLEQMLHNHSTRDLEASH